MKPLPIADYLEHLGRGPIEKAPPRREGSPFRPRTLASLPNGEPRSIPAFARVAEAGGVGGAAVTGGALANPTCPVKVWIANDRPIFSGLIDPDRIA